MTPLKQARLQARLTQVQLARRAHVNEMTVHFADRGLRMPHFTTQRKLAVALNTTPEALWPFDFDAVATPAAA